MIFMISLMVTFLILNIVILNININININLFVFYNYYSLGGHLFGLNFYEIIGNTGPNEVKFLPIGHRFLLLI